MGWSGLIWVDMGWSGLIRVNLGFAPPDCQSVTAMGTRDASASKNLSLNWCYPWTDGTDKAWWFQDYLLLPRGKIYDSPTQELVHNGWHDEEPFLQVRRFSELLQLMPSLISWFHLHLHDLPQALALAVNLMKIRRQKSCVDQIDIGVKHGKVTFLESWKMTNIS